MYKPSLKCDSSKYHYRENKTTDPVLDGWFYVDPLDLVFGFVVRKITPETNLNQPQLMHACTLECVAEILKDKFFPPLASEAPELTTPKIIEEVKADGE